ncbi:MULTISPECIES: septal ring lytic transglycosylase RlpA family protein [unclassified Sphingobium]|uniref:septal ring lytic transglycosylase RlpA family protein n=1 Tax=unclassified Sphingobium TaxID=2611147 RepID=UPI0035A5CB95
MRSNNKGAAIAVMMLALAGGTGAGVAQPGGRMVADTPVELGASYQVGGTTYTPADPAYYDEVGYAAPLVEGSQSGATASGEAYVPSAVAAAHKTLPLPSYVEVTALDSGRTILARVNDRGPMRNDVLIGLSPGAIEQLGVAPGGPIPVRVRWVNPPEQERAVLRAQGRAAERLETPAPLLKVLRSKLGGTPAVAASAKIMARRPQAAASQRPAPTPARAPAPSRAGVDFIVEGEGAPTAPAPRPPLAPPAPRPAPVRNGGSHVVQVAAFSSQARAAAAARALGATVVEGGGVWRVRLGPYPSQQAAQAGVRAAAAKGFENARIMANDAR